jgi:hypothetical protein
MQCSPMNILLEVVGTSRTGVHTTKNWLYGQVSNRVEVRSPKT